MNWIKRFNQPIVVVFDSDCTFCQQSMQRLRRLDWKKRLIFVGSDDVPNAPIEQVAGWTREGGQGALWAKPLPMNNQPEEGAWGYFALRRLAWVLPIGWLGLIILYLPPVVWVGKRIYSWIAANRHRWGCSEDCQVT